MAKYEKNRYGSIILRDYNGEKFTITKKEQQELKTLVKRANQRRYDKLDKYYNMTKNQANMKGISKVVYGDLLQSKGFITDKYSSSFKQFNSKKEYKEYIKELKGVTKKGYGNNRIKDIRETMIKRSNENYGVYGDNITNIIKNLKDSELLSLYLNNDDVIENIYGSGDDDEEIVEQIAHRVKSKINKALKGNKRR